MGRMIHPKARVHCPSFYVWNVSHKYGPVGRLQDKYASRMRRMRRCRRPSPEMLHVPGYDGGQVRLPPPSMASIPPPPPGDPPARRAGRRGAFSVPTPSVPPKGRRRSGGRAGGSSPGRRLPTSGGGGAYADPPTSSTAQEQTRASRTEQADLTGWCRDGPDLDSTRLGRARRYHIHPCPNISLFYHRAYSE